MKIEQILNEMSKDEITVMESQLRQLFAKHNLHFVLTNHVVFDRLLNDKSRQNIQGKDIVYTLSRFLDRMDNNADRYNKKIEEYKKNKKEIEGIITNMKNNLRIIFSIDYHRMPSQGSSGVKVYNFKLMTAKIDPNYKSDNFSHSEKFFIQ